MDDVLDVSARPRDPRRPLVCVDVTTNEQHREVIAPLPGNAGERARCARTYERNGVSNRSIVCAPREHGRHVKGTDQRTAVNGAQTMNDLVDVHVPDAERMVVVMDNRSTHRPSARYAAFAPAEATRIGDRLAVHDTPKHGAWRTMAESALHVLAR